MMMMMMLARTGPMNTRADLGDYYRILFWDYYTFFTLIEIARQLIVIFFD